MMKNQMTKTVLSFCHFAFEFVSDFDIRISYFLP